MIRAHWKWSFVGIGAQRLRTICGQRCTTSLGWAKLHTARRTLRILSPPTKREAQCCCVKLLLLLSRKIFQCCIPEGTNNTCTTFHADEKVQARCNNGS
eukprot:3993708-Amphidinium_carterae.2